MKTMLNHIFRKSSLNKCVKVKNFRTISHYCLQQVKTYDKENYLCSLLLPDKTLKSTAFALRALNIEISRINDQTKEPRIGDLRYKFWESAIDSMYKHSQIPQNPVIVELNKLLDKSASTKRNLMRLILSRRKMLTSSAFESIECLNEYLDDTVSTLNLILLEQAKINDVKMDHVASHLGRACGITYVLRSIEYNAKRHQFVAIPRDLLIKNRLSDEDILRTRQSKSMKDAVFELATIAHQNLEKAVNIKKETKVNTRNLFLSSVCAKIYLKRLRKHDFDVYHPNLKISYPMMPIILYWNSFKRSY